MQSPTYAARTRPLELPAISFQSLRSVRCGGAETQRIVFSCSAADSGFSEIATWRNAPIVRFFTLVPARTSCSCETPVVNTRGLSSPRNNLCVPAALRCPLIPTSSHQLLAARNDSKLGAGSCQKTECGTLRLQIVSVSNGSGPRRRLIARAYEWNQRRLAATRRGAGDGEDEQARYCGSMDSTCRSREQNDARLCILFATKGAFWDMPQRPIC